MVTDEIKRRFLIGSAKRMAFLALGLFVGGYLALSKGCRELPRTFGNQTPVDYELFSIESGDVPAGKMIRIGPHLARYSDAIRCYDDPSDRKTFTGRLVPIDSPRHFFGPSVEYSEDHIGKSFGRRFSHIRRRSAQIMLFISAKEEEERGIDQTEPIQFWQTEVIFERTAQGVLTDARSTLPTHAIAELEKNDRNNPIDSIYVLMSGPRPSIFYAIGYIGLGVLMTIGALVAAFPVLKLIADQQDDNVL